MHATSVDVENEFSEIGREVARLQAAVARFRQAPPIPASQDAWEAAHICASATEKIYTGLERIMAMIALGVDGTQIPHAEGWHRSLLQRLANPFPGVRAAAISRPCYERLDRLRAFRHRERNTYGLDLDIEIVLERSGEAVETFAIVRTEIAAFFDRLAHRGSEHPEQQPES